MPQAWIPAMTGTIVRDDVPEAEFNSASFGDRWASKFDPYGHFRGRASVVPVSSNLTHIYAHQDGHYISEYDNIDPTDAYRIIIPIPATVRGQLHGVRLVIGAYSHREILDPHQLADFVAYYSELKINNHPSSVSVTPYECSVPIDRGPGASYMGKVHSFELLPQALDSSSDKLRDYPYLNVDALTRGVVGFDDAVDVDERIMSACVVVELAGSPDLADVERRIVAVQVEYDRW